MADATCSFEIKQRHEEVKIFRSCLLPFKGLSADRDRQVKVSDVVKVECVFRGRPQKVSDVVKVECVFREGHRRLQTDLVVKMSSVPNQLEAIAYPHRGFYVTNLGVAEDGAVNAD